MIILAGQPRFFTQYDGEAEGDPRISGSDENRDRDENHRNQLDNDISVRLGVNA